MLATLLSDPAPVLYTAAGLGGVGLLLWILWRVGAAQPWLVLFVRVEPGSAETHVVRAALMGHLESHRLASTDDLTESLAVNRGTLLWHLRLLERLERVRSRRIGRVRLWYRTDRATPSREELLLEDVPHRRTILDAIEKHPGLSLSEVARRTGLAKSSVHRHVATLAAAGLVEVRRGAVRSTIRRAA